MIAQHAPSQVRLTKYDPQQRRPRTQTISRQHLVALIRATARYPEDTLEKLNQGALTVIPVGHYGIAVLDPIPEPKDQPHHATTH